MFLSIAGLGDSECAAGDWDCLSVFCFIQELNDHLTALPYQFIPGLSPCCRRIRVQQPCRSLLRPGSLRRGGATGDAPTAGCSATRGHWSDDGFLTASEIATLRLNADWVILSACNTAAGNTQGAEALSGLARAFFYAGARALLVSHWAVASDATVKLITGAVEKMTSDRSIGRAEAMRQSMLAMIDRGEAYEAHPKFWAPFVVVGAGATR
jgi:hypothetical protein